MDIEHIVAKYTIVAIAFYCEHQGESELFTAEFAGRVMSEIVISLGSSQEDIESDGVDVWGLLPESDQDLRGKQRGVRSSADGSFAIFNLAKRLERGDQLSIAIDLR